MKKILYTLLITLFGVNAFAGIEIYNNGSDSVSLYGTIRGHIGYGSNENTNTNLSNNSNMIYGLQGNSRAGIDFTVSNFFGKFELGASEATLLGGDNKVLGIRHFWGGYKFGSYGALVVGKMDTPSVLSGFASDVLDLDGGLNGFGGIGTGSRRFQIQYRLPIGISIAVVENDLWAYQKDTGRINDYKDIPRIALSYTFKNNALYAKLGATYGIIGGNYENIASGSTYRNIHAYHVAGGVKATFGNVYLSMLASYGVNADLYNEQKTVYNKGEYMHSKLNNITIGGTEFKGIGVYQVDENGNVGNVTRASALAEVGYKLTNQLALIAAGGYQYTHNSAAAFKDVDIHSYGVYVQLPYQISKNFAIITQVGYYETMGIDNSNDSTAHLGTVIAICQLRATF